MINFKASKDWQMSIERLGAAIDMVLNAKEKEQKLISCYTNNRLIA